MKTMTKVNVAKSSTDGHFVEGITDEKEVVSLDEINETYHVKAASRLVSKNHTTLDQPEECLITCQVVYNPFEKMFQKSTD